MTLSTSIASQTFLGNGLTQLFPCSFRIFDDADVTVTLVDPVSGATTPLTLNTDYTIAGAGVATGFNLSTTLPVASGKNLLVERVIQYTQPTDFTNQGAFFPTMHEDAMDRLGMQIQQLAGASSRSLQLPNGLTPSPSATLPIPSPLAPLAWNSAGTALENGSWSAGDVLLRPDLASTATGKGASLVGYLTSTVKSFLDSLSQTGASVGAALVGFLQSGTGAVPRTMQDKASENVTSKDFGAKGDGTVDDGASIAQGIADGVTLNFPTGSYKNATTAITVPELKSLTFAPGADIVNSGTGTLTNNGVLIRPNYNPDGMTWTTGAGKSNHCGLYVDMGGFGKTSFSGSGFKSALVGAALIPSGTGVTGGHGVSGYATTPGSGVAVALYGESTMSANGGQIWGLNTRSADNGHAAAQVWGYEVDVNVTNVNSTCVGVDVVGGSTVKPGVSIAYRVGPLGTFTTPKTHWVRGFFVDDDSADTGIELGTINAASPSGTVPIIGYGRSGTGVRYITYTLGTDASGAPAFTSGNATFIRLATRDGSGTVANVIQCLSGGLGFFNTLPAGRQVVTGSRGGNAALASLLTALANYGLITDSTTA